MQIPQVIQELRAEVERESKLLPHERSGNFEIKKRAVARALKQLAAPALRRRDLETV